MKLTALFSILLLLSCSNNDKKGTTESRPNIILIVADDMGYSDLGAFGGEIETPNLDALAAGGLTFSRFHTAPMCAVTRAMLLSGNDNHIAGMGSQDLATDEFGYEGHLTDRIIPFPKLLMENGYHTNMVGKWHLGTNPDDDPHHKGFEQSFALHSGGANHYSARGLFKEEPTSQYTEHGVKTDWPEGAYSTDFYTDKIIDYIDQNKDDGKPFFAYVAYTTPHWPLQVDSSYWKKYEQKYNEGYEQLREKRFEQLKTKGLIPENSALPALHSSVVPWNELSEEQQKIEAGKMALYAGMVDNMDANIGRLLSYLKETNQYDNTIIIFLSDNGAAAADFYTDKTYGPFLREQYTQAYADWGTEKSFVAYGPGWAEAGTSPFKYFKRYTTEGGITTPLIISGPPVSAKGKTTHAFTSLLDIAPTFYDLAQIEYPNKLNGKEVYPLKGNSLLPTFSNPKIKVHDDHYVFALEHRGHIQIRKGDWKLVNSILPVDESNFELYNLSNDIGEQHTIRNQHPEKYQELLKEWEKYKGETKVQFPTPWQE